MILERTQTNYITLKQTLFTELRCCCLFQCVMACEHHMCVDLIFTCLLFDFRISAPSVAQLEISHLKTKSSHCFLCSFLQPPRSGPSRLMGHSSVAYRDSMLLFGGGESQNSPNNCLWRYSFTTQTWTQVTTLPGSNPPAKIHHCCAGLGPSYKSSTSSLNSSSGHQTRQLEARIRPFKNKCFPAPLTFLGSEGDIELETFTPERCYGTKLQPADMIEKIGNCLTFENKAFRKQCSDEEEDEDVAQHLPDLLLVLGGRPCSRHSHISLWQMTLTDS